MMHACRAKPASSRRGFLYDKLFFYFGNSYTCVFVQYETVTIIVIMIEVGVVEVAIVIKVAVIVIVVIVVAVM